MNINAFNINTSAINSSFAETRNYEVIGEPGAVFHIIVQNNSGQYYNFPENTVVDQAAGTFIPTGAFSTTTANLFNKTIPTSGVYRGSITFPAVGSDPHYIITLSAGPNTVLNKDVFNNEKVFVSEKIEAFQVTGLTFSVTHSSSAVVEPSSIVYKGKSSQVGSLTTSVLTDVNWPFTLSSGSAVIRRQPNIDDFEFTTTKTTRNANTDTGESVYIELTDITGLSKNMLVQDSEGTSMGVIKDVIPGYRNYAKSTATNFVYEVPVKINDDGDEVVNSTGGTILVSSSNTWSAAATLTFVGKGSIASQVFNNTRFRIVNLKIELDDVVTTTTAAVPDAVIHTTSANGIRAQSQFTVNGNRTSSTTVVVDEAVTGVFVGQKLQAMSSGTLSGIPTVTKVNTDTKTITLDIAQTFVNDATLTFSNSIVKGIGIKNATTDPYVVSISTNDVTVNASQDLESGATVTFVNSSRSGKITGQIEVFEFGDDNITIDLNFDNILNVA
jgi:hypothetical protein